MTTPYLTLINDYLTGEGLDVRRVAATPQEPVDHLVVPIPRDDESGDWEVSVLAIPGLEDEVEDASIVQFMVELPFKADPDESVRAELAKLVAQVNNLLALTGFSYRQTDGAVVFRHLAVVPDDPQTWTKIVFETVFLVTYHLEQFAETVRKAAVGEASFVQAARGSGDPRLVALAG